MVLIGKIVGINTSDNYYNLLISDEFGKNYNLKIDLSYKDAIRISHTYKFECMQIEGSERVTNKVTSFVEITEFPFEKRNEELRKFYQSAPISLEDAQNEVNNYINKIDNKIIRDITKTLIEKHHEERYRQLLSNVELAKVFEKSEVKIWECRNCGHIVVGTKAPEVCATCGHKQSYFEISAENY